MRLDGKLVSSCYQALKLSRILVITGAGASAPLNMPAMDNFYKVIDPSWDDWISKLLQGFPEKGNDLEFLLGHLDFYEDLRDKCVRDPHLRNVLPPDRLDSVLGAARNIRERIFDTIVTTYGRLSPQAKKKAIRIYKNLYFRLLEATQNEAKVLPIFTTNYDLTFEGLRDEASDFNICNGIRREGDFASWDPTAYETQDDYRFAIFRLHRCSHWMKDKGENGGEIIFQARPDRRDLQNKEPCILYPVAGKEAKISEEPFGTAYKHLQTCLNAAQTVVIIGYSGRDVAIQRYLEEALARDEAKNLVLVTKGKKLRPELQAVIRRAKNYRHLHGGIEANTESVLKAVQGKL